PPRLEHPVIMSATPGGDAAKAGLNAGDIIESIDGITTREMNLVQVHGMLSNPVGKPAALSIIKTRRADPETINVPREVVPAPPGDAGMLEQSMWMTKVHTIVP